MKKIFGFIKRDVVNTVVLILTIGFFVEAIVHVEDRDYTNGLFFGILALFIFRFMIWHYRLWDLVNDNVTDNMVRVNIFHLPAISSNAKPKMKVSEEWPFILMTSIIVLGGLAIIGYFLISLFR